MKAIERKEALLWFLLANNFEHLRNSPVNQSRAAE